MKRLGIYLVLIFGLGAAAFLWSCARRPAELRDTHDGPNLDWFVDVTDAVGLDFVHEAGPVGAFFMPQIIGSGAALFDFDGDGRLDIYLLTNGGPNSAATNRLFRNMPDGTFKDVTVGSGLGIAGFNMGVAIGDVNNDGLPDVLVTQYGGVKLFLNRGKGKFEDITQTAGLANPSWGTSAAFFDFDRDGWLDLVIVNYVDYDPTWKCPLPDGSLEYCHPRSFPGSSTRLFRNLGRTRDGTPARFQDVSIEAQVGRIPGPGLGVCCADFDGDGWPDIFVANDAQPNRLWINQKDGTFREEAAMRGVAVNALGVAQAGMGVACGDVDGDGLMDVFVSHLRGETHTLWKQGPRGLYLDRTGAAGLSRPAWQGTGFGTALVDVDLDGHLDLAVVNGHVARGNARAPGFDAHWGWYADRNQLFQNDGRGRFTDVSLHNRAFCSLMNVGRGLAWGDIDGDGKVDLLVTSVAGRARLFRNTVQTDHHWLTVRTRLPSPVDAANRDRDRDALGAEVTLEANGRRWVRLVHAAGSYLSSSDARAHFGLGPISQIDRLTVRWPDGTLEQFPGMHADRVVDVRQGDGHPMQRAGP
jgi:enediyne biosynthesis protein E4